MESTLANNEIAGWVGPAPAHSLIGVGLDFQVKEIVRTVKATTLVLVKSSKRTMREQVKSSPR